MWALLCTLRCSLHGDTDVLPVRWNPSCSSVHQPIKIDGLMALGWVMGAWCFANLQPIHDGNQTITIKKRGLGRVFCG